VISWLQSKLALLRSLWRGLDDSEAFTVLLVPDTPGEPMERYSLNAIGLRRVFRRLGMLLAGVVAVVVILGVTLLVRGNPLVERRENARLIREIGRERARLMELQQEVERAEGLDRDLRMLTQQDDALRQFGIGALDTDVPPGAEPLEPESAPPATLASGELPIGLGKAAVDADVLRARALVSRARDAERRLAQVGSYLEDRSSVLRAYPSQLPVEGWITSGFGFRRNPWTGGRKLHAGIDVAAPHGTPVVSPADGFVIMSSYGSGYGNQVVIDHGYGLVTRFAHLSRRLVQVGDHVLRGQVVARVGSTGHSTGPHLHYEVHRNGVPTNPRNYILQ
jgi:hypothetical protein